MAELKTQRNDGDVGAFLASIEDPTRRADCHALVELMSKVTGSPAEMWGSSIVGFGSSHYTYATGREGDWFKVGFSPRKQNLTLYIMSGFDGYTTLLEKLGKHTTGKSCLYVKRLADVNEKVLAELVKRSVKHVERAAPPA